VNDALLRRVNIKQFDAKLAAIPAQSFNLIGSSWICNGEVAIGGGHIVIDSAES
jgi:hypothetical protein